MSGVVGIAYFDGRSVDNADLFRMIDTLAHRGPDGMRIWSDCSIGLGHLTLWTTPESVNERLPFSDVTGALTITADARIDNREELLSALNIRYRLAGEIGDGELILAAYERWGEHCPEHLLGDFAFAIWDARRQTLFCARDHFGVRPFYYYRSDNSFFFASEIKALLSVSEVPQRLNEVRLADYLILLMEDEVSTLYQGIHRLPPRSSLMMRREEIHVRCYWELDPTKEVRFQSDREYADAFHDIFTEAVRCRLRSVGPIGSTLSGGLDSSSIVCVARDVLRKQGGDHLHTFSGVYDDVFVCDERPYINAVLSQGDIAAHFVHPDRLSPLSSWKGAQCPDDEPIWHAQIALNRSLYESAENNNVRVLLDGNGGDEIVSHGTFYLTELAISGKYLTFFSEAVPFAEHFHYSLWHVIRKWVIAPIIPDVARYVWRALRRRNQPPWVLENIPIRVDFAQGIGLEQRYERLEARWKRPFRTCRQQHWLEITSGVETCSLEVMDRIASLFHIEARYPFHDRRLAEFCLSLPSSQKMRQGWTRMIIRRALYNSLPEKVLWRGDKGNIGPSFDHTLFTVDREVLEDIILSNPGSIAEYVDIDDLQRIYMRYRSSANIGDGFILWRVAVLALWLRRTGLVSSGRIGSDPYSTIHNARIVQSISRRRHI